MPPAPAPLVTVKTTGVSAACHRRRLIVVPSSVAEEVEERKTVSVFLVREPEEGKGAEDDPSWVGFLDEFELRSGQD